MWDMRYSQIYGYVVCYNGKAKMSFRDYFSAKNYLNKKNAKITPKKEDKMANWKAVVNANLAKARRRKKQKMALRSKGLTGTIARVKKMVLKPGRIRKNSKQVTNTRYVGAISKGKYIYRVLKIKKK